MRKLEGEVSAAMELARQVLRTSTSCGVQLKYESKKRHELTAKVRELEQQVNELKNKLGTAEWESAQRLADANELQTRLKNTEKKLKKCNEEYKQRAGADARAKEQGKHARRVEGTNEGLNKENKELQPKLTSAEKALVSSEGRVKRTIAQHSKGMEAAASKATEAKAKVEAAKCAVEAQRVQLAQYASPRQPDRERLAQLSKARQSQVRHAGLMYLYNLLTEREP
eukprot:3855087-Pleurochrysis_carterae.AAC.1